MEISSVDEIIKYLSDNKILLNKRFGVSRIGIFGSFAKRRQTASSDIDLVVELEQEKKNIHYFLQLRRFLQKELTRNIDLGFEHTLKPAIKEKIKDEVIYI
jgi:uncharacterized protein